MTASCWWQEQYDLAFPPVSEPDRGTADVRDLRRDGVLPGQSAADGNDLDSCRQDAAEGPETARIIELKPQCRATSKSTGRRCKRRPVPGATVCVKHGGGAPQVQDAAARRLQEAEARKLAVQMVGEVELARYADPFDCLEFVTSYSFAFAERLAKVVEGIPDSELRYEGKLGEQLRGEVAAMQRALSDAGRIATDSLKLGLAERRQRIEEKQVDQLIRAIQVTMDKLGLDLAQQDQARRILRAEVYAIEGKTVPEPAAGSWDDAAEERRAKARFRGPPVQ